MSMRIYAHIFVSKRTAWLLKRSFLDGING